MLSGTTRDFFLSLEKLAHQNLVRLSTYFLFFQLFLMYMFFIKLIYQRDNDPNPEQIGFPTVVADCS